MKTQYTNDQHKLTKSFRPAASLFLGAALALTGAGSSTAADAEAKATAQLFSKLTTAAATAPKVARITYTATLLSGKMRMALVSDGANVVCFVTDGNAGKSNTFSMEGNLEKGDLFLASNPLGHDLSGSRATFVGRMTATDFGGSLTLSGVRYSVTGRAAAAKSPAGLYHLYTGGVDIAVAVDEAGSGMAIAKRIKTGEVLSAKVTAPVAAGALPRTAVYGPTGSLLATVDVRKVRSPILGLLHIWRDTFKSAVAPVAVTIGDADLVGNPIRPFDIAVVQNPANDPLPSIFLYSERVQRRIVLQFPLADADTGSQLTIADSRDWRDARNTLAGQPGYLAVFENSVALDTRTDPGFDSNLNEIQQRGQLNRLVFQDGSPYLENAWSQAADYVGNLVKNPNSDGVSFGFTWTQRKIIETASREPTAPRALIRTSAQGVHRVLSDSLTDFTGNDLFSNAIGQVGVFPQSFVVPIRFHGTFNNGPFNGAHLVTDNSTSISQSVITVRDSAGRSLAASDYGTTINLDGMDLTGFRVIDGARMENDAVFLLTKHLNYWKKEGQVVSDGAGGLMYVGEPPRYREVGFGPLIFEEADRWMFAQQDYTNEPAMWALVRVNAQGVATLYHRGNEPFFATGLDVESTPEGKHVLVADNGPAGYGGRIIRVAPSEAALAAYQQRIQDNQGQ